MRKYRDSADSRRRNSQEVRAEGVSPCSPGQAAVSHLRSNGSASLGLREYYARTGEMMPEAPD